jgi:hypothetical protein
VGELCRVHKNFRVKIIDCVIRTSTYPI